MAGAARKERAKQLTPMRDNYAFHVASGLKYSDSYRAAFTADNMSPEAISTEAWKLNQVPEISQAIETYKAEIRAETGINAKRVTEMFLADRTLAHEARQAGAAVSATMGIAKVNGLLDKAEAPTAVSLAIEQSSPRDIAKAILRIMAQAVSGQASPEREVPTIDHDPAPSDT